MRDKETEIELRFELGGQRRGAAWFRGRVASRPRRPCPGARRGPIAAALRGAGLEVGASRHRIAVLVPDATRVARADVYLPALAKVLREPAHG
jgi:hypothetical protein